MCRCRYCLNFFFQAEDGIRDYKVTGVQTCALPISPEIRPAFRPDLLRGDALGHVPGGVQDHALDGAADDRGRSEERRVGKECRCGWVAEERTLRKEGTKRAVKGDIKAVTD